MYCCIRSICSGRLFQNATTGVFIARPRFRYSQHYNYWRAGNIPVEKCVHFDTITDRIIERKPLYVALTGGEPLLVFLDIKPCIEKMVASGIKLSISTNCTLLNDEMAEFFERNKVDMVVSLPSIDKDVCDAVCNAKGVVDTLQQKFSLLKEYHLFTTINVVFTRLNIDTLYDTLKAIGEWGVVARVGMTQKPINASKEYMQYALNKSDFDAIVKQT